MRGPLSDLFFYNELAESIFKWFDVSAYIFNGLSE